MRHVPHAATRIWLSPSCARWARGPGTVAKVSQFPGPLFSGPLAELGALRAEIEEARKEVTMVLVSGNSAGARCLCKTATARGAAAQGRVLNRIWASDSASSVPPIRGALNAGRWLRGAMRLLSQGVREEEGCWVALPIKPATA